MSNAAVYQDLTDAERVERAAFLKRLGLTPKGSAEVIPISHPARKPLGLRPVEGDTGDDVSPRDLPPFSFHFQDDKDQAHLDNAVSAGFVYSYLDFIGGVLIELQNDTVHEVNALQDRLKAKFDGIEAARRAEVAELKLTVTELRGELLAMKAVQEAARIASRGEQGLVGPRGIPGPPGEGRVGPQGPRGEPAAMIAAWEPRVEQFQLVPGLSSGERGPPISLRPFFEMYDAATEADDE
jgi:hypothetical protein